MSCRRHQSPVPTLVVVSSTDCLLNVAGDHGRLCLPSCQQPTLEQSTAHHLCSHTPCFLQPSKDIFSSLFFPLLVLTSLHPQWFSSFLTLGHFKISYVSMYVCILIYSHSTASALYTVSLGNHSPLGQVELIQLDWTSQWVLNVLQLFKWCRIQCTTTLN